MLLTEFFENYYYTTQQIVQHTGVSEQTLLDWQSSHLIPNADYHLKNKIQSSSFFGIYDVIEEKAYFARGYTKWIELVKKMDKPSSAQAFTVFYQHYAKALTDIAAKGISIPSEYFETLDEAIQDHWQLFLAGKYGVLTANGFIHEIVTLELIEYLSTNLDEKTMMANIKELRRLLERVISYPPKQLHCESPSLSLLAKLNTYETKA